MVGGAPHQKLCEHYYRVRIMPFTKMVQNQKTGDWK